MGKYRKSGSGLCPWGCGQYVLFETDRETKGRAVLEARAFAVGLDHRGREHQVRLYHRCSGAPKPVTREHVKAQLLNLYRAAHLSGAQQGAINARIVKRAGVEKISRVPVQELQKRHRQLKEVFDKGGAAALVRVAQMYMEGRTCPG